MKKLVASLLCLVMVLSLVACGSKNDNASDNKNDNKPTQATTNDVNKNEADNDDDKKEDVEDDGLTDDTLGGKLAIEFKNQIKNESDITKIAEALSAEDFCGYSCGTMDVEEGFLNGFSEEIKGFNKGVIFMPMIGSIPFVGYIFETDDAEGLKETLLAKADPRWNICTEAAETVCIVSDNYVFFTMCPEEE